MANTNNSTTESPDLEGFDPKKDLKNNPLPDLKWDEANRDASLDKFYQYVCTEANKAIAWYLDRKASKRIGARTTRLTAILLTSGVAIIPLLASIYPECINPVWASVALALAATCILLDRFFGFSSAWMRFLTTEMKIKNLLQSFQFDWQIWRAERNDKNLNKEQLIQGLQMCKEFIEDVNEIVAEEMKTWQSEFQSMLKEIDQAAKHKPNQSSKANKTRPSA